MTAKKSLSEAILGRDEQDYNELVLGPLADEIDTITDPSIRSFVKSLLLKADAFWFAQASIKTDLHPPDEYVEGGLVLHTKRVVHTILLLTNTFDCTTSEQDHLVAAALLHDVTKCLWKDPDHSEILFDEMHAYTIDRYVDFCREQDINSSDSSQPNSLEIADESIAIITRLIRVSHGMFSPIPETVPVSEMENLLHYADFLATNVHHMVDGIHVDMDRWIQI